MNERKHIEVVAAIIRRPSQSPVKGKEVFATQRGYGEWKDWWEFPGGKIEPGETREEAMKREIREEMATEIDVHDCLMTVEYDYPKFHLTMHCMLCSVVSGDLTLLEHEAASWLSLKDLYSVKWLPADDVVLKKIEMMLK